MNLQSILLVGMLLSSNISTNVSYYENMQVEDYEQNQEKMYLEQVKKNPKDIVALTELANYYENLWYSNEDVEDFYKAESVCKEIVKIDPTSTILAKLYAGTYETHYYITLDYKVENFEEIEKEYMRLLELGNDNVEMFANLGSLYALAYEESRDYDFFERAELMYREALAIDNNNNDIRYELIRLYEDEWEINKEEDSERSGYEIDKEYVDKVEQVYIEMLDVDEDNADIRLDMFEFFIDLDFYKNIHCEKTAEELIDILTKETGEPYAPKFAIFLADNYFNDWEDSDFTNQEAFDKAEYYYKYLIEAFPEDRWEDDLARLYEYACYYGETYKEEYFEKAETLYRDNMLDNPAYYKEDVHFYLAVLYINRWNYDLSDYTYYYMAESELYDALEFEVDARLNDEYSPFSPEECYSLLFELCTMKFNIDGDDEGFKVLESVILEQLPIVYANEISYIESGSDEYYERIKNLSELANSYYYLWQMDTTDTQYFEKLEEIQLKLLELRPGEVSLFYVGEMYTQRWLTDKDDVQYKIKAIQYFNEMLEIVEEDDYWSKDAVDEMFKMLEM